MSIDFKRQQWLRDMDDSVNNAAFERAMTACGYPLDDKFISTYRLVIGSYLEAAKTVQADKADIERSIGCVYCDLQVCDSGRHIQSAEPEQPVQESGDDLPPGMVKIKEMIADLQSIMDRFGNTCVYIKPGVSWGATALWRRDDAVQAIEETAVSFAGKFKPEYKELAQQIMEHAISEGWTHQFASPERESSNHWQPLATAPLKKLVWLTEDFEDVQCGTVEGSGDFFQCFSPNSHEICGMKYWMNPITQTEGEAACDQKA